jgi:NAD(P)-dependent dehydrogenase (short-subunit alcohol dehydrogenase family)
MEFKDRVALVTGSARGIGKTIARQFLDAGATVVVVDLSQEDVDAACHELAEECGTDAGERVAGFVCNVSKPDAVEALFQGVKERFDRLDILVNNAGITRDSLVRRMSLEQWQQVIDVNLTGTYLCCRYAVPLLRRSPSGRIVNMSSVTAGGNIGQANYAASKAAVIGLTKTLALEFAKLPITVNAIAPGFIDTEMTRAIPEKSRQQWIGLVPMGRAGTGDDVAAAVLFLASEGAGYITGEVLGVDGGL